MPSRRPSPGQDSPEIGTGFSLNGGGSMSATDEFLDSGSLTPRIAKISVVGQSTLAIEWMEGARAGRSDALDLTPIIGSYRVYRPLRSNAGLFRTARLIEDGDVVAWDGPDLEMTA